MTYFSKALLCGLAACALSAALPASAQETAETYEPAYFEAYAPRTALDMVERVPGFQIRGPRNQRGLGQGGANVLINGERISGKTDPEDQLSRITAPNVVRIEILDGTSLDIPGLSGDVANVITETKGLSGTWEWRPQFRPERDPNWFAGDITVSGESGDLTYSAKVFSNARRQGHAGPEVLTAADGTVFEVAEEQAKYNSDYIGINGDVSWKPKDDHVLNLNATYEAFNFNLRENSQRTAITNRGDSRQTVFSFAEDEWVAKFGGDYEFPLGPKKLNGKFKLIGYYRFEHSPTVGRFDSYDTVLGFTEGSRFTRLADEAETIARAEYSWSPKDGRDWSLGIEGAFNYLDIASGLVTREGSNPFETIDLGDDAASRVEEKRSEITLTHSRTITPKFSIQLSLGGEYSQLSQNTGLKRDFFRPKGFLSTTYKPVDDLSIEVKLERAVGQLRFFDFISSVSLQDDFNTTGNVNLVPSQAWKGLISVEKDFGKGTTVRVNLFGRLISDLVDRIPIGVDGDAVGNIDSANLYGFRVISTIKGERWGLDGMELESDFAYKKSSVDDPLTGAPRRLNNDFKYFYRVNFRHDVPKTDWAYGAELSFRDGAPAYRISTIGREFNTKVNTEIFVEHKDVFGLKVKASLINLNDQTDNFTRQIFTDRRDLGVLDYTETRERDFGAILLLNVSGTF